MKHTQFKTEGPICGYVIRKSEPEKPYKKPFKNLFFIWYLIWVISSIIFVAEAIVLSIPPDIFFPLWAIVTACCLLGTLITKLLTKYL
jgi:hypothetical protein